MSTKIHPLNMSTKIRPFWKKISTRIHCPQEFSIPGFSKGFFLNDFFSKWFFFNYYLLFFSDNGHYNCIWIHRRTPNVLELQYGRRPSTVASFELCDYNNFWSKTWTTVASMFFNFVIILAQFRPSFGPVLSFNPVLARFWPLSVASFELCDYLLQFLVKNVDHSSQYDFQFCLNFGPVLALVYVAKDSHRSVAVLDVASFEFCDYNNFWSKTWTTVANMIFNFVRILAQFGPSFDFSKPLKDHYAVLVNKIPMPILCFQELMVVTFQLVQWLENILEDLLTIQIYVPNYRQIATS